MHSGLHHSHGIPSSSADALRASPTERAKLLRSIREHEERAAQIHRGLRSTRRALFDEPPAAAHGNPANVSVGASVSSDSEEIVEDVTGVVLVEDSARE